jgi:uncharacterized protein YcbK (DUF882 family)
MASFAVPALLPALSFMPEQGGQGSSLEKSLSFYNIHTGESLKNIVFYGDGSFIKDGLTSIYKLFRDHRQEKIHTIDPTLLFLLHELQAKLDRPGPFHLISGYRSPVTNAMLHGQTSGVARQSQHCLGKAADVMLPGVSLKNVRDSARGLKKGGVGMYSGFVHVDTGRVRWW